MVTFVFEAHMTISRLKGKVLGCWCKPYACHGEFLAEQADKT
ncbi:DUF4326 domain-containing protein [Methanosarcina acetivorans]